MKTTTVSRFAVIALATCLCAQANAGEALQRLQEFTSQLKSLSAGFVQSLYDTDGNEIQESSGVVVLKRPGKFRWDYRKPYHQLLVANGERFWIYDSELQQVTEKRTDEALATAPVVLLSRGIPLADQFELKELGEREGLSWVELLPKVKDSDFERIFLGLDADGLKVMELRDSFGQATQILFHSVELNIAASDDLFEFEPPEGADVIRAD